MKIIIASVFLCLTMTVVLIGAGVQPIPTEESVVDRFLRTCYEVTDYTTLPYETLQRDFTEETNKLAENAPEGIILIDNSECREFLTDRFSGLCSDEQIEKMMADLILLDHYRVLSTSKFNATVEDVVLIKKPSDVSATRRLYSYELTILVKSTSTGQEAESTLSGRIATDIVDGEELVVYINYGGEIFPAYPQ